MPKQEAAVTTNPKNLLDRLCLGKMSSGSFIYFLSLIVLICLGIFAFLQQLNNGLIVTGMRTIGVGGSPWGLYISLDIYFVGVSFAGITIAALIRLFNLHDLKPISRIAELMTIVSLILAMPCIMVDLGRPLKGLMYLPQFARPLSPFFGTFTLVVAGYLFSSLVYFYLAGRADMAYCASVSKPPLKWLYIIWASGFKGTITEWKRHHSSSFWLSLAILPLLVTAHSTLGFIFGIQSGRPGWYSALQAPGFVIMAGVSGIGMLIVVAAILRKCLHLEEVLTPDVFKRLGRFLWILTLIYIYMIVVEELTANYAAHSIERSVAHEIVFGSYSIAFWVVILLLLAAFTAGFLRFLLNIKKISWIVASGVMVNIAAILKRFLIVVPSQTHGTLLSYPHGRYFPSWVELLLTVGIFSLGIFLYSLFVKLFPIVPVVSHPEEDNNNNEYSTQENDNAKETPKERFLRLALCLATILLGLEFSVVGFLGSARFATKHYLDPVIPWSPVIFIIGVMLCFYSIAVYEVTPSSWLKPGIKNK